MAEDVFALLRKRREKELLTLNTITDPLVLNAIERKRQKDRKRAAEYERTHKEQHRERSRRFRINNPDKVAQYARKQYYKDHDLTLQKVRERRSKWTTEQIQHRRDYMKKYYREHQEELKKKSAEYSRIQIEKDPERYHELKRTRSKRWREKMTPEEREEFLAKQRMRSAERRKKIKSDPELLAIETAKRRLRRQKNKERKTE